MSLEELFAADRRLRTAAVKFVKEPSSTPRLEELRQAAVSFGTLWNRIERAISNQEGLDREAVERVFADQKSEPVAGDGT